MLLSWRATLGLDAPKRGGSGPRILLGAAPAAAFAAVIAASLVACSNDNGDQVTQPVGIGMTSTTAPYFSNGQLTLYQVETEVKLPVRKPTSSDKTGPAPKGTPYPHAPFLLTSDESVEVRYVLANLDTVTRTVWLLVDPWNEFVRWKPGVTVVNDDVTVPNFGYDLAFVLPPQGRVEGTLTPDDMTEIATKLASVQNLLASPQAKAAAAAMAAGTMADNSLDTTSLCNNIFNPQNRSNSNDLLYTPWIPPVVPGVTGFDLGIRTTASEGTMGAANVAVEVTVEVQDLNGDRMVAQDTTDPQIGVPPQTLSPPAARF
jgi:hypothetical protein